MPAYLIRSGSDTIILYTSSRYERAQNFIHF